MINVQTKVSEFFAASRRARNGFTLIELLIVIAIIGILAAVVIIAVNPGRQLAQANNSQRSNDANAILNAIGQFMADNAGTVPTGLDADATSYQILGTGASCVVCPGTSGTSCVNLAASLVPTYITSMPLDPQGGTAADTRYGVNSTGGASPRISLRACNTQTPPAAAVIEVTR